MRDSAEKIRTLPEISAAVGARPRARKVVMAAGVFDLLHPGHIRHLQYAKGKGDVLVVSITADRHITKGQYRPHIPQDLRAMQMAALEVVDYVVVDSESTPIANIEALRPDFFAKGSDYQSMGNPKTAEEARVVEGYGGQILFTPGDIVFSSTKLLNEAAPSIRHEKLLAVMQRAGRSFEDLTATLSAMRGFRIHVLGDTIIDSVTYTAMIGGQTKTPTISVLHERREDFVGGAGIVAKHLRAAGAEVVFSTVLGDDELGRFALADLEAAGVSCLAVTDPTRPTTNKNAIDAGGYRLLKVDTLDNRSISDAIASRLCEDLAAVPADAVVLSDFRHGIFNRHTIPVFIDRIRAGAYRVADSQVASRWGNITDFCGFDLITPNEREARFALGDQDAGVRALAEALFERAACKTLILKLGERGLLASSGDDFFSIDAFTGHVVDPVGAGDALLAYATLAMLASRDLTTAAVLGSIAAALECEAEGNVMVTPEQVARRLEEIRAQAHFEG